MKKCSRCQQSKPLRDFSIRKESGKPRSDCKQCNRDRANEAYRNDPNRFRREAQERRDRDPARAARIDRRHHLKVSYGMTEEEYDALILAQKDSCALCGGPRSGPGKTWHIDHNPINGKVRGLLCSRCNTALGLFKDSISVLRLAIKYIQTDGEVNCLNTQISMSN